ncbi:MAG: hypothetical protein K8S16_01960, partial [Bacteroidales bacterium]|nr:hypothetical protein [Bacteroidales bacterium]
MKDPNQNYNELISEFDNYCLGKDSEELSSLGYKHIKRWKYANEGMAGTDGKLLPASYFSSELEKFKQLYGNESIVGDWDFMGPDIVPIVPTTGNETGIGRLACIAFHPTDANTIYVGAHTGGIWKTTTGGDNWTNLNTDQIPSLGVSAIFIHPVNPNIILIGTGDRDASGVPGQGIWKSIDGGNSWTHITSGMDDKLVSEILVWPDNDDILLAGAYDGVYISTDIGDTWLKTSGIERNVKDMVFKPGDPSVVYATGHGEFYKSTTFGLNWSRVTSGLFTTSRMAIGVTPDAPNKVFIFATRVGNFEGFYVSTNSGQDFTKIPTSAFNGEEFGSFCIAFGVDPTNEDNMFAGMQAAFKSLDGGNTWANISGDGNVHADQHAIEFSPYTNDIYIGCDGGLYHSSDGGVIFENICDGLEVTQVCRMAVSETNPDVFLAGLQDNGTIVPANGNFHRVRSQDGMTCAIDYTDDQYMYASDQHTHIFRSTTGNTWTGLWENISGDITEEIGWFRPYILDKNDPNTMFAGFQNLWRSNNVKTANAGDVSWVNISDNKVLFGEKKIELIEQSMADGNIIYISFGNGVRMYRTDNAYDADPDWVEITRPENEAVTCIETHGTNPDIVYMAINRSIYKSIDRGATWMSIT